MNKDLKMGLIIIGSLIGYGGYVLLVSMLYVVLEDTFYAPLVYGVAFVLGFGMLGLLRDKETTCKCCRKDKESK